nr:hypothetical protein [Tanacetum cinerariifolium]
MWKGRLKVRENWITTKLNKFPRGRMWLKLTSLVLVEGMSMLELFHCAISVSFTTMARALQNVVGHLKRDCWNPTATNNQKTITCYECGNHRHFKSDCPELKNRNHGNQAKGIGAHGMGYALGGEETNQDLDEIEDDINA